MSEKDLVKYTRKLLVSPPTFTANDLFNAITLIMELLASTNETHPDGEVDLEFMSTYIKIASFLSSLRTTGLDHTAEYIAQAAKAVLQFSDMVDLTSETASSSSTNTEQETILDIVGTGGDGQNTFNVSTSAAIVASGIPGIKICKHGGKASTSNSGAGDLIGILGCDSSKVTAKTVNLLWNDNQFLFLLAPYFHDGMGRVALIRKLLGIPTIFNVLGPLLHPVKHIHKRVLGVYSKDLALEYAKAAALVYPDSETFVVWGNVGLDEVSPIGKTTVWHVNSDKNKKERGHIESFDLEPSMFGLMEHPLDQCASLGPRENARILTEEILSGKYSYGDNHPIYDYILLNTAVLYCLSEGHRNWKQGVIEADKSIQSGASLRALSHFIKDVQSL
ncbi:anthranilate phosphoribosyltransferase NDAI_0B05510 [Naumovozyma dairenensis CBS 421]|uniref:Glycosyl transferase family 3 domain-containing protein n=1 Tax=Naumovozyma dairenensis (strain ATCC 10597 / BCRC 20456 / CBS 421 / NBRC 0211 / NRRL Y-12639) TaxID=1071378 RepID=G0W723_NAUDC|nr:hypothetical protein NDAI_0B05510 [Naumovozyma dairenensis CBS 421]CCD23584.1 hypothetical protein NDAI_0B05510 [Naumovozyma dairenensis CBS 421]